MPVKCLSGRSARIYDFLYRILLHRCRLSCRLSQLPPGDISFLLTYTPLCTCKISSNLGITRSAPFLVVTIDAAALANSSISPSSFSFLALDNRTMEYDTFPSKAESPHHVLSRIPVKGIGQLIANILQNLCSFIFCM